MGAQMGEQRVIRSVGPLQTLTRREVEILDWAGHGLSMKSIARVLRISSGTVSWHLKNAYQKLDVGSREEALKKAQAQKIIRSGYVCAICASKFDDDVSLDTTSSSSTSISRQAQRNHWPSI